MGVREEFSRPVRKALREQAGNTCSHPTCNRATSYPKAVGVVTTGVAAHILPASGHGPRSQFLSMVSPSVDRSDVENGIWLCETHASQIDKNNGDEYPPFLLQAWKKLHATTQVLAAGGVTRRVGWMHQLQVTHAAFPPPRTYDFGPANLIVGESPSGKSTLLELITASDVTKISSFARNHGPLDYEVRWFDPNLQTMEVTVDAAGNALFRHARAKAPVPPTAPRVVRAGGYGAVRDLAELEVATGVKPGDAIALLPKIGSLANAAGPVGPLGPSHYDAANQQVIVGMRDGNELALGQLSGGEQAAFALEIAVQRALTYTDGRPLVVVFDPAPTILQQHFPDYLAALATLAGEVQLFLAVNALPDFPLPGWNVISL